MNDEVKKVETNAGLVAFYHCPYCMAENAIFDFEWDGVERDLGTVVLEVHCQKCKKPVEAHVSGQLD